MASGFGQVPSPMSETIPSSFPTHAPSKRTLRLECDGCRRAFEFEVIAGENLGTTCPGCGGSEVRTTLPIFGQGGTGTYWYLSRIDRMAKVSDRVPGVASGSAPAGGTGGCCGGGGCGCR